MPELPSCAERFEFFRACYAWDPMSCKWAFNLTNISVVDLVSVRQSTSQKLEK